MHSHPDHPLQALTGQIYEAALDDNHWDQVSAAIAASFRASSASLSDDAPPQLPEQVFCWQRDQWERNHPGHAPSCSELCSAWCRQAEVHYVLGASFHISPRESGLLQIRRPRHAGPYADTDRARIHTLLPHLQRAMQLRLRLGHAQLLAQASAATLAHAALAAFVVDAELQLLYATPLAQAMLARAELFLLTDGHLQTRALQHGATLARLVSSVTRPQAAPATTWLRLERGHTQPPLTLVVAALAPTPSTLLAQPAALILVRDPTQACASLPALQQLFDLTPAEAGVAQALASSGSLEQVAQSLQISTNTVKTHLHHIFEKTATKRQGELIALIHGSIATQIINTSSI
ncbi:MAG: helix-turn-helix transcriptional regulator [Sphingomonadaceae bacterium]